jgi:hypothetical protein
MKKSVFVTTMWSEVPRENGLRREQELKTKFLGEMLGGGCRVERFDDTYESAWHIVCDPEGDQMRATGQQQAGNQQQQAKALGDQVEGVKKGLREDAKKERAKANSTKCVIQ